MTISFLFQGYFKCLMTEKLGSDIGVTLLCPGPVFSNLLPQCFTAKSGKVSFFIYKDL